MTFEPLWWSYPHLVLLDLNNERIHAACLWLMDQQYDCIIGFAKRGDREAKDKVLWDTATYWSEKTKKLPTYDSALWLAAFRFSQTCDAIHFKLTF